MATPYPPPPWRLRGEALIVPAAVRRGAPGPGLTLGGIVLARYGPGSTLEYHELVVFAGVGRAGARVGLVVAYIAVDSPASLAGGREIWGLPKRLAEFAWTPAGVAVAEGGVEVLRTRVRRRGVPVPLAGVAPFVGELESGPRVHTVARGRLRGAPALVDVEVPAGSPLAAHGVDGRRAALAAGALDLHVPAPRGPGRGARAG
jgi:acetoacetate decarboxylase